MKLTEENLRTFKSRDDIVVFNDGKLYDVVSIVGDMIGSNDSYCLISEYADIYANTGKTIYLVSDIREPQDLTALKESEGSKLKNCAAWFNDLEESELRRMCLANMDEHFGQERKAHSLVEAIELAVFKEDKDKEYWERVITNLKALTK